jgi:hypothetical protein
MPVDYLLDDDNDLRIEDGDFLLGESTLQHQNQLIVGKKGDLRQFPKTNVGIDEYILDDAPGDVYIEIRKQLGADGNIIRNVVVTMDADGKLNPSINAYYP